MVDALWWLLSGSLIVLGLAGTVLPALGRNHRRSIHVGVATWIGVMVGMIAKVVLAFVMLGVFAVALLV